jgi:methylmalonyl-CoA/ethylmalonyl-CoA epimerase
MSKIKGINHLAVVVQDIESALQFWRDTLGLPLEAIEEVQSEGARVAFLPLGESRIELVEPTDPETGLARYLAKRGPGFHHLCLEVEDLAASLAHLDQQGVELVNSEPAIGEDGRKYAFLHPKSANGVLVELYQLPGK